MRQIPAFLAIPLLAGLPIGAGALAAQTTPLRTLPGDDALAAAAASQHDAAISRGGAGWLVVWEDERASLAGTVDPGGRVFVTDILAARLDATGALLDTVPIVIDRGPFSQEKPRVAWNGSNWLVVWESERLTTFWKTRNVLAARVSPAGVVLDPTPIVVDDADDVDEAPWDVASDGSNWAVLWQDLGNGSWVLDGAVIDNSGTIVSKGRVVTPSNQFTAPWNVRLDWAGGRYLMAYTSTSGGLQGRFLDSSLATLGSAFNISGTGELPEVATNGAGLYVSWGIGGVWGEVRGTPVSTGGAVAVPGGELLSPGFFPLDPHPACAWDGSQWQILWGDWTFSGGWALYSSRADAAGALAGGPELLTSGSVAVEPALGSGSGGVMAAWTDQRLSPPGYGALDIFGAPLLAGGGSGAQAPISASVPAQVQPDVAGNDAFQLVAAVSRTSGSARILAWRTDLFGNALDPAPVVLATGSPDLSSPAVAWNGSLWLVAWEDFQGSVFQSRILGVRVASDGTVLDAVPVDILPGNEPAVAALGDVFLVASTHEPIDHQRYTKAARVRGADGAVLDASPILLSSIYSRAPVVTAFADRWMVAWQDHGSHDSPFASIAINTVLANGTPGAELHPTSSTATEYQAGLAADDSGTALLTWFDGDDLRGARIQADGTLLDPASGFFLSTAANEQFDAAVAWNGRRWHAAWTDWRLHPVLEPALGDAMASGVDSSGQVLDPSGVVLEADPSAAEGNVAVSGARGTTLATWTAWREETPLGNLRVTLSALGPRLQVPPLHRGQSATLVVEGAEPGDQAWFLFSTRGTGPGPCPGSLGGLCLDLRAPLQVAGSATTGGGGTALLTVTVPANAPLAAIAIQTALRRGPGGGESGKTDAVVAQVLP